MSNESAGLADILWKVINEYPVDKIGKGMTSNPARKAIERELPERIRSLLPSNDIEVRSSAGQGRWTSIPWVAVVDPRQTDRIQEGIYVVYLFEPQENRVSLTLNQGVTELKNELGTSTARERLRETAREIESYLRLDDFSSGPLEFPHASSRNELYGPGTIKFKRYSSDDMPSNEQANRDLKRLVEGYLALAEDGEPAVYQCPIKPDGSMKRNYGQTVLKGVDHELVEGICDIPIEYQNLRVWGNRADTPAKSGDYLLFAEREGRYDGEYTFLARIADARILNDETATEFTDAVGWGEGLDSTFPHVMFLDTIHEADVNRETLWELLGFSGWPNDSYSRINFDRDGAQYYNEYDSIEAFVDEIKGQQIYPRNKRYYWLNTWQEDFQEPGGEIFCTAVNKRGGNRNNRQGFNNAMPGDEVIIYHGNPVKQVVGRGYVLEGLHTEYSESRDEVVEGITVAWDESIDGPSWDKIKSDPQLADCDVVTSNNNYYVASITGTEYERFLELAEISTYSDYADELAVTADDISVEKGQLHYPASEWDRIKARIKQALNAGNHVLLFGPPGTGKTKLARQVCTASVGKDGYELVTASADWSTFDTVGGYRTTSENRLVFEPGVVLDRFHADNEGTPANEWLVIDELNRADIDKAFGSLFSALTGESVTLPFDDSDGEPIQTLDNSRDNEEIGPNRYYIPEDWRMLATINTLDKTSLYEMSYAFMRRWAFIPVGIPDLPEPQDDDESELVSLIESYVKVWVADDSVPEAPAHYEPIGQIWRAVNEERAIGPAIVEDIYEHVAAGESQETADYVSPIIMYVFPQLEGLRRDELERLIERLDAIVDDGTGELWRVARDFFQVDLQPGDGE